MYQKLIKMSYLPLGTMYHSALEHSVSENGVSSLYQREAPLLESRPFYSLSSLSVGSYATRTSSYQPSINLSVQHEYAFMPDAFLRPGRAAQPFVGDAAAVKQDVKEAFFATTEKRFPTDIRVAILNNQSFNRQVAHPGVVGFSLNRKEFGMVSDVVVRAGPKDHVMLTIGHEIGHVLSRTLCNKHCEEAKAFAFSRAWMKKIRDRNIAGLHGSIILDNPAHNGLHDVASAFVWRKVAQGHDALQLYWDLVVGRVPYVI